MGHLIVESPLRVALKKDNALKFNPAQSMGTGHKLCSTSETG